MSPTFVHSPFQHAAAPAVLPASGFVAAPSTRMERLLLAGAAFLLPFDDHFPTVGPVSISFLLFGLIGAYAVLARITAVMNIVWHPLFLAGGCSLLVSVALEALHGNPSYGTLLRVAFMYAGAVLIAALCRDTAAVRSVMHGLIAGGVLLSILLVGSTYSILSKASAVNFRKASLVRGAVAENVSVGGDLNMLAFYAAMGAAVAIAIGMSQRSRFRWLLFMGAAVVCAVGAFVPMSRGGMLILALASLLALRSHGLRITTVIGALLVGVLVLMLVPDVVFSRMSLSEGGRVRVYDAVVDSAPEYALVGVGAGNYWNGWAYAHGIRSLTRPLGTHNSFIQSLVYWGVLGLLTLVVVVLIAWRCVPAPVRGDGLRIAVRTFAFTLLLYMFVSHTFQDKHYSLGFGLLAASSRWIWPRPVHPPGL